MKTLIALTAIGLAAFGLAGSANAFTFSPTSATVAATGTLNLSAGG